jgi:hypothetical protein
MSGFAPLETKLDETKNATQLLAQLQCSLAECKAGGISCGVTQLYTHGQHKVIVVLEGVVLIDGRLVVV